MFNVGGLVGSEHPMHLFHSKFQSGFELSHILQWERATGSQGSIRQPPLDGVVLEAHSARHNLSQPTYHNLTYSRIR